MTSPLRIGPLTLGGKAPLFILGPCVIESPAFLRRMARRIHQAAKAEGVQCIFKASYDKANRSAISSFRGPGIEEGCRLLAGIREEFGMPVTTDIHTAEEAGLAGKYVDVLQVPAFLCRQTDLLRAAADTGKIVNVKKGQFLAPWDLKNVAEKLESFGCRKYFFTERGTTFGYNNLVADMRSLFWIREAGYRIVFDATHSVQRPGSAGKTTAGDSIIAPVLARAAMAAGCDGIFLETHEHPERALSDGPNQIPLSKLPKLLHQLRSIHEALK